MSINKLRFDSIVYFSLLSAQKTKLTNKLNKNDSRTN